MDFRSHGMADRDFRTETTKQPGIDIPQEKITDFCRRHRIRKLSLFGSVLRDDFTTNSDVDVLVEFEPGSAIGLEFFAIERELSSLLGRTVDLNTRGFLGKYLRERILSEAEVVYESA
jgi:uncharacterized protein